jgi:hypothetical protein
MKANILKFWTMGLMLPFFASCGSGSDPEIDPEDIEPAKAAVFVSYTYEDPGDMLTAFDIAFTYNNEKGETITEAFTTSPWTKTLSNLTLPFKASLKITFTPKENIPEKVSYKFGRVYSVQAYQEDKQAVHSDSDKGTLTFGFDHLEDAVARYSKEIVSVLNISWEGNAIKVIAE